MARVGVRDERPGGRQGGNRDVVHLSRISLRLWANQDRVGLWWRFVERGIPSGVSAQALVLFYQAISERTPGGVSCVTAWLLRTTRVLVLPRLFCSIYVYDSATLGVFPQKNCSRHARVQAIGLRALSQKKRAGRSPRRPVSPWRQATEQTPPHSMPSDCKLGRLQDACVISGVGQLQDVTTLRRKGWCGGLLQPPTPQKQPSR